MDFAEYLDLQDDDGPKLRGHRIWLFNILYEHVKNYRRADQIVECYPTLDMEMVYACLLYYERNKVEYGKMMVDELKRRESVRAEDRVADPDRYRAIRERLATRRRGQ